MAKLTLNTILGQYASTTELNANFALIETAVENTVSRDGTAPNTMSANLDLNSNDITNARNVNCDTIIAGGQTLVPSSVVSIDTASSVPNVAAGNIVATDVQAAINELDTEKMKIVPTPVAGDLVLQAADGELSKAGYGLPNVNADVTASDEELNYLVGVTSAIQTQIDTKASTADVAFKGALVYPSSTQSIPNNTATAITYNSEDYDTDSIHDTVTNNTRLTVPSGATRVRLTAFIRFISNATGYRQFSITKNGGLFAGYPFFQDPAPDGTLNSITTLISPVITVSASDYFEVNVLQTSGGALSTTGGSSSAWFAMEIIE